MLYTIENSKIKVTISDMGAEMTSLVLKKTGTEYLWQADTEYWTGHAYNLFPICGRLWDGKYTYKGNTYEMNLHGFARKTEYQLAEQTETIAHLDFQQVLTVSIAAAWSAWVIFFLVVVYISKKRCGKTIRHRL